MCRERVMVDEQYGRITITVTESLSSEWLSTDTSSKRIDAGTKRVLSM